MALRDLAKSQSTRDENQRYRNNAVGVGERYLILCARTRSVRAGRCAFLQNKDIV